MRARVGYVFAGLTLVALVLIVSGALLAFVATLLHPGDGMTILGALPRDTDAADSAVLDRMRNAGSNLARPTDVTYYLYFPIERDARAVAASLRKRGFNAEVHPPLRNSPEAASDDWGVLAEKMDVPSLGLVRKTRKLCLSLAAKYHGFYDGWEASVVK